MFSDEGAVVRSGERWGVIDNQGNICIPMEYDYIDRFTNQVASAKKEGKWGYINKYGKELVPFIYDGVGENHSLRVSEVRANEKKLYFINYRGAMKALYYDFIDEFYNDYARVRVGEYWGYINDSGEECIAPQFSFAGPFVNGIARVKMGENWFYIDKNGRKL